VRGLERLDGGQHGCGLGLVAFEGLHYQREPRRVDEQADGDLWLEPPLL